MTDPSTPSPEMPTRFTLRARRGGEVPCQGADGRLRLRAEGEWVLSGAGDDLDEVQRALPGHSERLGAGTLLLVFGNSVGKLDLPHLGRVEVCSGKWGEDDFDRMLSELLEVAGSLPFSLGVGPLLPQETSAEERERIRYHAFLYLRHVLSERAPRADQLVPVLELILREPHRRWRRTVHTVPLEAATRIDPGALTHLFGERLRRVDLDDRSTRHAGWALGPGVRRLAHRLGGHLPERIREQRVESDVDTPENRFVLHFLRESQALVREMTRLAASEKEAFSHRLKEEAKVCSERLDSVLRARLWDEVAEPRHLSLTSTVLQGRRGYREVFRHWLGLRQGTRVPLRPEEARRMAKAKDVALLYELWCFFRVVDQVRGLLGAPVGSGQVEEATWEAKVRSEYRVDWPGVSLAYDAGFSRRKRRARVAYSNPFRPDIVLTDHRGGEPVVHVFDAKFRIARRGDGSRDGREYKRQDLAKMHAYRDAILPARTAWVLYPGEEHRVFPVDPEDTTKGGVGAIPLVPGGGEVDLREVIQRVLGRERVPV
jgi:hypothetical protein